MRIQSYNHETHLDFPESFDVLKMVGSFEKWKSQKTLSILQKSNMMSAFEYKYVSKSCGTFSF